MPTLCSLLLWPLLALGTPPALQEAAPPPAPGTAEPAGSATPAAGLAGQPAAAAGAGQGAPTPEGTDAAAPAADTGAPAADASARESDRRGDELPEEEPPHPVPVALHVGPFNSMRCGRLTADGALDTGAGVLVLVDGETGRPLVPLDMQYARGPQLWVDWHQKLGDVSLDVRMLVVGTTRNGDERAKAAVHLVLLNETDAAHVVKLGARVLAGGGDPLHRPVPSLPFQAGIRYAREDNVLTRDGAVLLTWVGAEPTITIPAAPAAADAPGLQLDWTLEVPPQSARYLDLFMAGPNATGTVDETAWRDSFTRWTYGQVEETLQWQSDYRGYYADFQSASTPLRRAMVSAVHQLRMMGNADRDFRQFTDHPYGHPATDVAVEAQCLGLMAEWGWAQNGLDMLRELMSSAVERGQELSLDRRVALVHGLACAVRLGNEADLLSQLATAIRALVTEPAAVEPWLDPDVVRQDLQGILDRAGPAPDGSGADYAVPELRWAGPPASPVEALMLEMRRQLTARDTEGAWATCRKVLARQTVNGFGWTGPEAELDGRYHLGLMALVRAMLFDDHGDELHVFPAIPLELVPPRGQFDPTTLPTQYGLVQAEMHYVGVGGGLLSFSVQKQQGRPYARLIMHLPAGADPLEVRGAIGGQATLLEDGTVECVVDPFNRKGLRYNVKLKKD